jgi:hypothetical protein
MKLAKLVLLMLYYLMTLSVSRLYSVDVKIINDYDAVGGMKIVTRFRSSRRELALVATSSTKNPT